MKVAHIDKANGTKR